MFEAEFMHMLTWLAAHPAVDWLVLMIFRGLIVIGIIKAWIWSRIWPFT